MRTVTYAIEREDYEEHGVVFTVYEQETRHYVEGDVLGFDYVASFPSREEAVAFVESIIASL